MNRIAFFAQDLIGDALVWANMPQAMPKLFPPCEVTAFCTKGMAELFRCMAFCDHVVAYDIETPWTAEEAHGFGRFDIVLNTRYDADSAVRVDALDHGAAYGFENIDIPETICKRVYKDYVPLSRWDDGHLRWETGVTEQGAELIRLFAPDYHCQMVQFGENEFAMEMPPPLDAPRVVFVPGAGDQSKRWELENFLEVARFMAERGLVPLFLLGPNEAGLEAPIAKAGFALGKNLPFRQIAGLLDCDGGTACVVGNDTGLMHLACALGTPSVTIFAHGHEATWFPYVGDSRAPHLCASPECSHPKCLESCPQWRECLAHVPIATVMEAIAHVFAGGFR